MDLILDTPRGKTLLHIYGNVGFQTQLIIDINNIRVSEKNPIKVRPTFRLLMNYSITCQNANMRITSQNYFYWAFEGHIRTYVIVNIINDG